LDNTIVVALLSCAGTLIGSLAGIMATAKMTAFRLEQLEKKVEKHNNLVERMVAVEQSAKSAHLRIDELGD
jgi:hypothetical protein